MILLTIEVDIYVLILLAAKALICVEIIISYRTRREEFKNLNINLLSTIVTYKNYSSNEKIKITLILRFLY